MKAPAFMGMFMSTMKIFALVLSTLFLFHTSASAAVIAQYNFDGNLVDATGNSSQNGSVLAGSPSFSSNVSPAGGCCSPMSLQLGPSDAVSFNYPFPFNTTDSLVTSGETLRFWVNPSFVSSEQDIFWTTTSSGDTNRFNIGINSAGRPFIDWRDPSGTLHLSLVSSIAIAANTWTELDYVKQKIGPGFEVWLIFVNGVLAGQSTDESTLPNSTGWTINGRATEQPNSCCQFSGLIDNVTFFNEALSPIVPLPGALPLFATGLAGLGLLGWRRKGKALSA
jgi:hypothetical protein